MRVSYVMFAVSFTAAMSFGTVARSQSASECNEGCGEQCGAWDSGDALVAPSAGMMQSIVDHYGIDEHCDLAGEQDCFENQPGQLNRGDLDSGVRRLINAIDLADDVPFFGDPSRSWEDVIRGEGITWIEPDNDCTPFMVTWGTKLDCHIEVSRRSMMATTVWMRAAAIVHEARHCHDVDGTDHTDNCSNPGCDVSYWDEGGYQWTVEFLAQFATARQGVFLDQQLADAVGKANRYLSTAFEEEPGFRYWLQPGAGARHWTAPPDAFQYLQVDDSTSSHFAITRLAFHVEEQVTTGGTGPVVNGVQITGRFVMDDGTLAGWNTVTLGVPTNDPQRTFVVDAGSVNENRVITMLTLGWMASPSPRQHAERMAALLGTALVGPNGAIINQWETAIGSGNHACGTKTCIGTEVCSYPNFACIEPTLGTSISEIESTSGEFLSGLGIGTSPLGPEFELDGQWRLPPQFVELPHAGTFGGGLTTLHACPTGTVATGILGADSAIYDASPVGFFGLICAPELDVLAGTSSDTADLVLVHPIYWVDGQVYPSGVVTGWDIVDVYATLLPHSPVLQFCPNGYAVDGLRARSRWLLQSVDALLCEEPAGVGTSEVAVDIGWGAIPDTWADLFETECPPSRAVTGFRSSDVSAATGTHQIGRLALLCGEAP